MSTPMNNYNNLSVKVPLNKLIEFNNKYLNLAETFYCVNLTEQPYDKTPDFVTFSVQFKYVPDQQNAEEIVAEIQHYVESAAGLAGLGGGGGGECGEDSSYDSELEETRSHRAASRTSSDTLAAEFAEHVTLSRPNNAKVEFALKLGYTERVALTALQKLGPDPPHNELLAELTRLETEAGRESVSAGSQLRHIVIDGSNVAMSHGNKEVFSSRGIELCVEWFRARGHTDITVFVPKWRKEQRPDNPVTDRDVLDRLERERVLVYTPSRQAGGKRLVCYDDRYILRLAAETDGIVVSNDNYHDLAAENAEFRKVVDERILMYTFVNDRFMPPDDPLGRAGPTLDAFLSKKELPPPCPYDRKCTYGNKCKYYHPERARGHKALKKNLHTLSLPPSSAYSDKKPLARAQSATPRLPDASLATHFDRAQLQLHRVQENPHRKLARQLTSCDPKLPGGMAHATAARVASAPAGMADPTWSPSAPWPNNACSSESALPLWETRRRMHYHLSGIFPEAQVSEAMAAYPDETDAQNMCAIILARYRSELPRYHHDYRRT